MPDPVFASLAWYQSVAGTIINIYQTELFRDPEPAGLFNWIFHAREEGKDAAWILAEVQASPEWHALHDHPQPQPRPPLPPFPAGSYDKELSWQPPDSRDFLRADAWGVVVPGLPFV